VQAAVQVLAGQYEPVERLRLSRLFTSHQDSDRDPDLAVAFQCSFQVHDLVLVQAVDQGERGIGGEDRRQRDRFLGVERVWLAGVQIQ
jgi:hypothetical protein